MRRRREFHTARTTCRHRPSLAIKWRVYPQEPCSPCIFERNRRRLLSKIHPSTSTTRFHRIEPRPLRKIRPAVYSRRQSSSPVQTRTRTQVTQRRSVGISYEKLGHVVKDRRFLRTRVEACFHHRLLPRRAVGLSLLSEVQNLSKSQRRDPHSLLDLVHHHLHSLIRHHRLTDRARSRC
jgi:hypothetical protein